MNCDCHYCTIGEPHPVTHRGTRIEEMGNKILETCTTCGHHKRSYPKAKEKK